MADADRTHVINRATGTLALYFLRGAEASPGAVAFDLIALDAEGTSAGATVCRDCVSRVGAEAFARVFGTSPPADPEPGTWKAILDVGAAPAYDLVPQSELQYDAYCAECACRSSATTFTPAMAGPTSRARARVARAPARTSAACASRAATDQVHCTKRLLCCRCTIVY